MKVGFEERPLNPGCYRLGVKREIIMEDRKEGENCPPDSQFGVGPGDPR